jgi:phosphoribosyl 1,2-cyclic phosphodiesterase/ActR/RegA family two-component response regulator
MKTVLIIDDDSQYRRLMAEILQGYGWRVLEADEGEAGLDVVRRHRPQVVLCDLLMPRCNGFQVCRAIRNDLTLRNTRIIVTSGRDFESDRNSAREAGADEYLTKPVQPQTLVAAMEKLGTGASNMGGKTTAMVGAKNGPARIKFWGVRGSIPTPGPSTVHFGGNTTCVEVRAGNEILILDAGTGLRMLGKQLAEEFDGQPLNLTLLLTHTHWDHIQGLPFFRPVYQPQCRLRILGYEGARKSLVNVLSGQMESPYFPVLFDELPGNIQIEELKDMEFQVGNVRVKAWFANHPGICVGYRIFTEEGSIAFFPDNEPHSRPHHKSPATSSDQKAAQAYADEQEQRTADFLRGTDVLILDSQYDTEEYKSHIGWGHGCVDYAVSLAERAEVKKLFLFHHDPEHDDAKVELMQSHARKLVAQSSSSLEVDAAREGTMVQLSKAAGLVEK